MSKCENAPVIFVAQMIQNRLFVACYQVRFLLLLYVNFCFAIRNNVLV